MAQSAYTGVMGSGKTYEAVKSVLVPGLRDGRRVVTNITGLQPRRISDLLNRERRRSAPEFSEDDISARLIVVEYDRPNEPGFWPTAPDDLSAVVRPGDLVIMDEAWRYCRDGEKLGEELMLFVRMHRQWADPVTKVSSDIVWIIQDIGSLHRKIRNLCELIWVMKKHRKFGLPGRYVAVMYDGKIAKSNIVKIKQYKYEKKYFDLYKSYAVDDASEEYADKRLNLARDPKIIGITIFVILMIIGGFFAAKHMRSKYVPDDFGKTPDVASTSTQSNISSGSPGPPPTPRVGRVLGFVGDGQYSRFVVVEQDGQIEVRPEADFTVTAFGPVGSSKNGQISPWSAPIQPLDVKSGSSGGSR